ncbi:unnamed protein product, partial [Strongylus vulgaris]
MERTVHIWIDDYDVPKIIINYSNEEELREVLQQRLKGLKLKFTGIPLPELGATTEFMAVKNVDDLVATIKTISPACVKNVLLWCAICDEQNAEFGKEQVKLANKQKFRSPSL